MRSLFKFAALTLLFWTQVLFARDPLGDQAQFQLDRARDRTSSLITAAKVAVVVDRYLPDDAEGPSFNHHFTYDVTVRLYGKRQGEGDLKLPSEVYTPEFMEQLRQQGEINSEKYKMRHLGSQTVQTSDGREYQNADIVLIYDLDLSRQMGLINFMHQVISGSSQAQQQDTPVRPGGGAPIEDAQIKVALVPDLPLAGAVKIDISGTYQGVQIKAGFDKVTP